MLMEDSGYHAKGVGEARKSGDYEPEHININLQQESLAFNIERSFNILILGSESFNLSTA